MFQRKEKGYEAGRAELSSGLREPCRTWVPGKGTPWKFGIPLALAQIGEGESLGKDSFAGSPILG